jgi:hypothetical protein
MRILALGLMAALFFACPCAEAQTDAPAAAITEATVAPVEPAAVTAPSVCLPDQISVHPQHHGVPMRLGDWLTLVVSGPCSSALTTQIAQAGSKAVQTGTGSGVGLLLNDTPMQNLPLVLAQGDKPGQTLLSVRLLRDSEDSDNRDAWNIFLRNGESCCEHVFTLSEMDVAIALAIGNSPAMALAGNQNIQFHVEERRVVAATFWVLAAVFLIGFWLCVRSPALLRDKPDGSYSLAKSQMAWWGLIVALSFSGVWFVVGTMEAIPNEVLILLGISATTGWLAPMAGASSVSNAMADLTAQQQQVQAAATVAATQAQPTDAHTDQLKAIGDRMLRTTARTHLQRVEGFLRDICSDGDGVSVHRVQAVAWTFILGVVFVCEVTTVISMPVFSTNLLLLLGISNGTYLTLKTKEQP